MEFRLNGKAIYQVAYGGPDPNAILSVLFASVPNLEFWSEEALQKFLGGTLELVLEFCQELIIMINHDLKTRPKTWHKRESAKTLKRRTQNLTRKLTANLRVVPHLRREQILKSIYDIALSCDNLSPLRNFGMANKFGDSITGNPEKQSIRIKN